MSGIYGQENIWRELNFLISDIQAGRGRKNILLLAPSGYGKTIFAKVFLFRAYETFQAIIPTAQGELPEFFCKEILVDEVHLVARLEPLYPLMDSGEYAFVFTSNVYGELPEAFLRRCIIFQFSPYSEEELIAILGDNLVEEGVSFPTEILRWIVRNCKPAPGFITNISQRLGYVCRNSFIPDSVEEVNELFSSLFGIKNGLDLQDQAYLEALKSLGGLASLDRISLYSSLPKGSIQRNIEPFLISRGLIKISSKGRQYVGGF